MNKYANHELATFLELLQEPVRAKSNHKIKDPVMLETSFILLYRTSEDDEE